MNGPPFHSTFRGHQFFSVTLPRLVEQLKRVANQLERVADALEKQDTQPAPDADNNEA